MTTKVEDNQVKGAAIRVGDPIVEGLSTSDTLTFTDDGAGNITVSAGALVASGRTSLVSTDFSDRITRGGGKWGDLFDTTGSVIGLYEGRPAMYIAGVSEEWQTFQSDLGDDFILEFDYYPITAPTSSAQAGKIMGVGTGSGATTLSRYSMYLCHKNNKVVLNVNGVDAAKATLTTGAWNTIKVFTVGGEIHLLNATTIISTPPVPSAMATGKVRLDANGFDMFAEGFYDTKDRYYGNISLSTGTPSYTYTPL